MMIVIYRFTSCDIKANKVNDFNYKIQVKPLKQKGSWKGNWLMVVLKADTP